MEIRKFIIDCVIAALLGFCCGMFLEIKEVKKESERLYNDIKQIEWVKSAKEVQPQNNLFNMGLGYGSK